MTAAPKSDSAEIAVLNSEVGALRQAVTDLRDSTNQQFGALNARFDVVTGLVREVTRIQEQQSSHGSGLGRAFTEIERVRTDLQTELDTANKAFDAEFERQGIVHAEIEKRLHTANGWLVGAGVVVSLLLAVLIWVAAGVVERVKDVENHSNANEVKLLQHKLEEAQKENRP